jgi:quinol monooxygenase YgiN
MSEAAVVGAEASTVSLLPVFVAKPERRSELLEHLVALEHASRADAGCLAYRVFRDTDRPDRFVLIEEWTDRAALEAHNAQPHVAHFIAATPDLLVEPFAVTRLMPVA